MNQTFVRKIGVVGLKSHSVVIPVEIIRELKLRKGQHVQISVENNKIIIEKWY